MEIKDLIERFLSADTTPEEEVMLKEYLKEHASSDEEKALALLLETAAPLSDAGAREYDALVRKSSKKRFILPAALLAAAVAAIFFFSPIFKTKSNDISPIEIVRTIETLASLKSGEVDEISAKPLGDGIVIKAKMKDGSTLTWILVQGDDGVSLTAMNQ